MQHLTTNQLTQDVLDRDLLESLMHSQRPKTKAERQKPIYYAMCIICAFCQITSFVLASSGVLFLLVNNFQSATGWILILLAIVLLAIFEGLVWIMLKAFHSERLDDKRVNKSTILLLAVAFCLSTPLSYVGSPYAVSLFAAAPDLVDVGFVEALHDSRISFDSAYVAAQIIEANDMANDIHSKNSYKGKTSRKARAMEQAYISHKLNLENMLIENRAEMLTDKESAVQEAITENEIIKQTHEAFCASFGGWLALVTIIAMVVLFGATWYKENWKRLYVAEGKIKLSQSESNSIESNRTEKNKIISIQTDSNKTEQAQPVEKQAVARNPIKFGNEQHGQLFTPQGAKKPRVRYEKEDGSLTEYTQSDLIRMVNRPTGTPEYKAELKRLIDLFKTVEQ